MSGVRLCIAISKEHGHKMQKGKLCCVCHELGCGHVDQELCYVMSEAKLRHVGS